MTAEERAAVAASLRSALSRLGDALGQPKSEWTRDAAIQRFEFSFELAWKATARHAHDEGIDCASPRQALKAALRLGWIVDDALWLAMLSDRNRTSHAYNEKTAEEIFGALPRYHALLSELQRRLEGLAD